MVALMNSPYSVATFFPHNKAQFRPRIPLVCCTVRVSSSLPSRRIRRKNYLRPKILRTLSKPYPVPLPDPTPEDSGVGVEPNVVVPLEPMLEELDSGVSKELETSVEGNEGGLGQLEVVGDTRGTDMMAFKGFPGRTMFKVVVSFVGLFVLQTVVSVWIMGSGDSDEKDRSLRIEGRYANDVRLNGNLNMGDSTLPTLDELKIAEIRRMAREVRAAEKRKKNLEEGEDDVEDVSDDEGDFETDSSLRNDIGKEIDGRLTMLRKRSAMPGQNVNFLKKAGSSVKEVKNEGMGGKDEDNRLMFEAKRKFRSHMAEPGDKREKPKGFEGYDTREKGGDMNDAKSGRADIAMGNDEEKPATPSSSSQASKKSFANEEENMGKRINGSSSLRSDNSMNSLSKGISEGAKPERGVLQDYSNSSTLDKRAKAKESSVVANQKSQTKTNDTNVSTSEMQSMGRKNGKPKSSLSRSENKHKINNDDQHLWWSTLPCLYAILMQKGRGSEAQQGFYTLDVNSDAEYESSYTVAFEDQNDARNFSYILDSVFEDLPDAAVDVVRMSTKEIKEIVESLDKNVLVARKGVLKLYAGQALADAESALRLLVK